MPKKRILLIAHLFLSFFVHAQSSLSPSENKYPTFLSASFVHGTVWKHRSYLNNLPNANPNGIELNFGQQTTGRKGWQQMHNYPRWGMNLTYFYLDNQKFYGHGVHLTPYMDLFLLRRTKHELFVKIGTGIAFYSYPYHPEKNPDNVLVSLPISASGLFRLGYRYQFTPKWSTLLTLNFDHASNGSLRQPNLGINIPGVGLGVHYTIHPERMAFEKQELPPIQKKWSWNTNLSFSTKQSPSEPLNDVNYMAYTLSTYLGRQVSPKSIIVAGLDGCYDESLRYSLRDNPDYKASKYPIYRFAAMGGYELVLTDKTHIMMQNAFYLYDPYKEDVLAYQRYGFKFIPIPNLYFSYYLKTHFGKADFWEFAIGVRI